MEIDNSFLAFMSQKGLDVEPLVSQFLEDSEKRSFLLEHIEDKEDNLRYNCFRILTAVSERRPALLYPEWNRFEKMLFGENSYHRNIALVMLANLCGADGENRFAGIFEAYFGRIQDEKFITARYCAQNLSKIARNKPEFRDVIADRLLAFDFTASFPNSQKELIKCDILGFFESDTALMNRADVRSFIESQLNSSSPKNRKTAKDLLKKMK